LNFQNFLFSAFLKHEKIENYFTRLLLKIPFKKNRRYYIFTSDNKATAGFNAFVTIFSLIKLNLQK